MKGNLITFKGSKDGIHIHLKDGSFELIKKELDQKLRKAKTFFQGAKVLAFKGKKLTEEEIDELKNIINEKYGIYVADISPDVEESSKEKLTTSYFMGIEEGDTKFIRATVRSGQCIEYHGNVVILGDVNPGGIVVAKGNIIVLGSMRGVAVAGSDGNRKAVVAAFNLQPTQLRIADIIARCPDEEELKPKIPEIASIKDNILVIEPYLPKK